jgi:hypothetical protein
MFVYNSPATIRNFINQPNGADLRRDDQQQAKVSSEPEVNSIKASVQPYRKQPATTLFGNVRESPSFDNQRTFLASSAGDEKIVFNKHLHVSGFSIANSHLCLPRQNSSTIQLLMIVNTAPEHQVH